jgi:hypothetical protein
MGSRLMFWEAQMPVRTNTMPTRRVIRGVGIGTTFQETSGLSGESTPI